MGTRVPRDATPAAPKGAAGANDLEVLQPDQQLTIGGRTITVREYRIFEGLQLRASAKPFFDAMYALFNHEGAAPSFDDIADVVALHETSVVLMVSASADCEPEWIRSLNTTDGDALLLTWWMVNSGFFIRCILRRASQAGLQKVIPSAGLASSTTSSPPDTSAAPPISPS